MPLPLAIPAMIAGGTALSGVSQFLGGLHQASAANKNYKLQKKILSTKKGSRNYVAKGGQCSTKTCQRPRGRRIVQNSCLRLCRSNHGTNQNRSPANRYTSRFCRISRNSEAAITAMNAMAQKAQIDKTFEENKLIRLQQDRQALENNFMSQSFPEYSKSSAGG